MMGRYREELNRNRLLEILGRLRGRRILVLGDLFLDEYLVGRPTRISREAPVLVLEYQKRFALPGGGTNPARNLAALGVDTLMAGVVGSDEAGEELKGLLRAAGIETGGVVVDPSRPTITKTRILAHDSSVIGQQIVRMDRLSREPLDREISGRIVAYLDRVVDEVDAVLLSDYKSGVITEEVLDSCRRFSERKGTLLTVDSQGDLFRFGGFGLVKCNQAEAEATLGEELDSEESFDAACRVLLERLGACVVMITRGANGLSLMHSGGSHTHIPVTNRSEVFDVTGAGDTAIAVVTAALVAGARPVDAAHLANYAAGLVVRKIGNATTTVEEMRDAITTSRFPRVDTEQELPQEGN